MADETIIFQADIEVGEFIRKAAEIQTEINKLKENQKELSKNGQANSAVYQANAAQLRKLNTELKDVNKQIDNTTKANNAATGSIEQQRAQLALLTAQYNKLSAEERENTVAGRALGRQLSDLSDNLKENESAIGDNRRNVGNYANSIAGLEKQLIDLNETIKTLDIGSDAFKKAQDDITKTKDKLGLAKNQFNEFGERIKKGNAETLDTFNDVGQGIVAAFALAPLFDENSTAAQLQANALKAIAIAQNAVAISKGIANLKEAQGIVVTKGSALATKGAAAAQALYATVVGKSTGAMKIFKVALASTGIGLLVLALGELIANFDKVTSAIGEFFGVSKKLSQEENEALAETSKKKAEQFKQATELIIANITDERQRRIREIEYGYEQEIKAAEGNAILLQQIEIKKNNDLAAIDKEFADKEQKEREDRLNKAREQAEKLAEISFTNRERRIKTELFGSIQELALFDLETEKLIKAAKKRGEDLLILERLRAKERLDIQQKVSDEFQVSAVKTTEVTTSAAKKGSEELREKSKQLSEGIKAQSEENLENDKKIAESEKQLNEQRAASAQDVANSLISALSTTEAAQKRNAGALKALALAQAIINGFLAVQKALGSAPPPFNFISAATVGVATAANVAKIVQTPAFARGGLTGKRITSRDGIPIQRSNGDNLLATVRTGEVILNERHQTLLGGPRTFARIGVPGFADGGFTASQVKNDSVGLVQSLKNLNLTVSVTDINKMQSRVKVQGQSRKL